MLSQARAARVPSRRMFQYKKASLSEMSYRTALADELPRMTTGSADKSNPHLVVEALYEKHLDEVHRYLLRIGVRADLARELCQESFVRLFLALRAGKRIRNPRAWLFTVAHNSGIDSIHASLRDDPLDPAMATLLSAHEPSPEQELLASERAERVRRAVRDLPASERHCMHLRAEGLRYREIADVLGLSTTAIAESMARSVKRIREALHD